MNNASYLSQRYQLISLERPWTKLKQNLINRWKQTDLEERCILITGITGDHNLELLMIVKQQFISSL